MPFLRKGAVMTTSLSLDVEDLISERPLCTGTQNQYRRSVKCFSNYLARPAIRCDLQEQIVNRWLTTIENTMKPETVRGRKAGITAIWNWLADRGCLPGYNPNRLRKVRRSISVPRAWTADNVRLLLKAAKSVPGNLQTGLNASDFLSAWIWLAYETGLRPGDIRHLKKSDLQGNILTIIQHKTGRPHSCRISPEAAAALFPLMKSPGEYLFGIRRSTMRRWELMLFREAGRIGFVRCPGQGLGTLRKTHATELCRISDAGTAALSLGHVSGCTIAIRHYIQPDAIALPESPPKLFG